MTSQKNTDKQTNKQKTHMSIPSLSFPPYSYSPLPLPSCHFSSPQLLPLPPLPLISLQTPPNSPLFSSPSFPLPPLPLNSLQIPFLPLYVSCSPFPFPLTMTVFFSPLHSWRRKKRGEKGKKDEDMKEVGIIIIIRE